MFILNVELGFFCREEEIYFLLLDNRSKKRLIYAKKV